MKKSKTSLIPQETIEGKILLIRSKKIILDSDLAVLYGVETKQLTRQVRRNIERFPDDFMFQLTREEYNELLRCQIGTLKRGQHSKYLPYAFTEHGILMLSSVLNSKKAIHANIQIMRTFTKLREMLATHKDLQKKIVAMEGKYDKQFKVVFDAIRSLMTPPEKPKSRIGFRSVKKSK
jgi:phage regulator Rha-like protein